MRRALGRLLGVVFTLALVSVIALAALSTLAAHLVPRSPSTELPLFFNARPSNVHDRAELAVQQIAQGVNVAQAEQELARLGGAALPHVLPKLDTLRPVARGRVALALTPVAERMDIAKPSALSRPEDAIAFWVRFWQDHAFDFRPQVVRRLVERLAERSSELARDDLVRLDTYAVPELVAALGRIRTETDVQRARRLTLVLAHVTERGPVVDPGASLGQARAAARAWRRFFVQEGADFTTLDGPRRVVAMFAQTQYGRWLGRVFGVVRVGQERQPALGISGEVMFEGAMRYLATLAGCVGLGVLWARLELQGSPLRARLLRLLATIGVALPASFLVALLGTPSSGFGRGLFVTFASALLGAAVLSRTQLAALADTRFSAHVPSPAVVGGVLRALPSALPWVASSLFVLEVCLDVRGVSRSALHGLFQGDVTAGMTLALGGALGAAAVAALGDAVLTWAVPVERQAALIEVGGVARRRLLWTALGTAFLVGVFGAGWSSGGPTADGAPGWSEVAQGARALLGYGMISVAVAGVSGLALGTLSASGPRPVDAALVRTVELAGALPAVLWAAALSRAAGPGLTLALALGLVRGIDVAWMLRAELLRRAHHDQELGMRSLGHYPLAAYYRQRLRPAALPALCALATTPAWWAAVGAGGFLLGTKSIPGHRGWDALLGATATPGLPALVAAALLSLTTGVLLAFLTAAPRRLGALRASVPPPELRAGADGDRA